MRKPWVLLVSLVLFPMAGYPKDSVTNDLVEVVREFQGAFNAQDAEAMSAHFANDVQWLSIRGSVLTVELEGKEVLEAAMREYFASCPSCRSEIKVIAASNERVSVVEVASWTGSDGPSSQQALAVYEFSGSLIQRIYYFPEEALPGDSDP